jgi:hypothetical protein
MKASAHFCDESVMNEIPYNDKDFARDCQWKSKIKDCNFHLTKRHDIRGITLIDCNITFSNEGELWLYGHCNLIHDCVQGG